MTEIQSVPTNILVSDLKIDNPPPEEKWYQRDDFDPTYGMKELRDAARKGLIELDTSSGDAMTYRFRLTRKGRES